MRIVLIATMPESDVEAFLQTLVTWEAGRPEVNLAISVDAPTLTVEEVRALMDKLEPKFPYIWQEDYPNAP